MKTKAAASIQLDFSACSELLIIAFGSLRLGQEIPPFEWIDSLASIPAKKIFVRDLSKLWYQKGFLGLTASPDETVDFLRPIVAEAACKTVITTGGSMGGYGAILFGSLLQADQVHAFAPQTFLPARKGRILLKTIYGRRWPILRKQLQLKWQKDRRYFDLRPLLQKGRGKTEYHIYFSLDNEMDAIHAGWLAGLTDVQLHAYENVGHHVARHIRDSNTLQAIFHAQRE